MLNIRLMTAAESMSRDETRRIAKLPELLRKMK